MSFNINNIGVNEINFNGNEVNSLYVNNTLVWERYGWVGWQKATWSDIYDLCLAVRNTGMKWPSDIKTGIYKTVSLDNNFLGSVSKACYLVGIDVDGPGTLTFQTQVFSTTVQFSTDDKDSGYWGYGSSNLKTVINSFENYASAINPYVIPLEKVYYSANKSYAGYTMRTTYSKGSVNCKYWAPSIDEMGHVAVSDYSHSPYNNSETENEFTVGVTSPYQYLTTPEGRKKVYGYWTRSIGESPGTVNGWGLHVARVSEYGSIEAAAQNGSGHVSICFTIGYFE